MSSTTSSGAQGYLLLVAAAEEAARAGHAVVDVDHLFLGLLVSGGVSTPLLTAAGLDLATARNAVRELQRGDLDSLGISTEVPAGPERIGFGVGTENMPLTARAQRAVTRQGVGQTDAAVLEALLADRRGAVRRLVEHLGADADILRTLAAQASRRAEVTERRDAVTGRWNVAVHHDVAVPRSDIWQLVSDPHRLPVWYGSVVDVEVIDERTFRAGFVEQARRGGRDEAWTYTVVSLEQGRVMEWEARDERSRMMNRLRIEVDDAMGGSRVTLRYAIPALGRLFRIPVPVPRWMLRAQLHRWLLAIAQTASR